MDSELQKLPSPREVRTRNVCLGFTYTQQGGIWIGYPELPFKPFGLMLWNVPPNAYVTQVLIGSQWEVLASSAPIPAKFFTRAQSYEEISKQIENSETPLSEWCSYGLCNVGSRIQVQIRDDMNESINQPHMVQMVMWGKTSYL